MTQLKAYKLTIKKANGDVYWVEVFNDLNKANRWLATEQTRPYWDNSYTHTIEEM